MIAFSYTHSDDPISGELLYNVEDYVFQFVRADETGTPADVTGDLALLFVGTLALYTAMDSRRVLFASGHQLLRFRQERLLDIPLYEPGRLTLQPGLLLKTNYHPLILRRERLLDMVTGTPDGEYPDPEQIHSMLGYRVPGSTSWPLLYDPGSGWYCLGDPQTGGDTVSVEFATNSVATLLGSALTALWLKPRLVSGSISDS